MKYSLYAKRIFKWNLKVADDTTLPGSQIHSEKFISGKTLNTIGKKKMHEVVQTGKNTPNYT